MKKFVLALLTIALMMGMSGMAFACEEGGCYEPTFTYGELDLTVGAIAGGIDGDVETIPNGMAIGVGGAGALAGGNLSGFIINGEISGETGVVAGGLTNTETHVYNPNLGDHSIGVVSVTENYAIVGGEMTGGVDPGYLGYGVVGGILAGGAAQGSLNVSVLGASPIYFESNGLTGGSASQGSVGSFEGYIALMSGGDYGWCRPINSRAGAGISAEIVMNGYSYSESYRFIAEDNGATTEGMGTFVGAGTTVDSNMNSWERYQGAAYADAYICGVWEASGNVNTITVQGIPGVGGSIAAANGRYYGTGGLGSNYSGSATGYSQTTMTTVAGMQGAINTANAGMTVSSTISK